MNVILKFWLLALGIFLYSCGRQDQGRLYPYAEGKKYGYVNEKGEVVVNAIYERVYDFSEGMGRVYQNQKYGFVNAKGEVVIPTKFGLAYDFKGGIAIVNENYNPMDYNTQTGGWTFIDKKGTFLTVTHNHVKDLGFGFFAVEYPEGYWEILQYKNGKLVKFTVPYTLDEISYFTEEGVCSFRYGGYAGVIDKTGAVLIEPNRFINIGEFHDGLAVANDNNTKGYITLKGDWVYSENFTDIYAAKFFYQFKNGFAVFEKDKYKYTYMDKTGKLPFSQTWVSCSDFTKDGFARVAVPDKQYYYRHGVINLKGEYVLKPVYRDIQLYENNLVVFQDSAGRGLMNIATQKVIIPPTDVDEIVVVEDRVRLKKTGEKWGYINEKGEFVIQPAFDFAGDFEKGVANVYKGGYNYFINKKGEKVPNKATSAEHNLYIDTDGAKDVLKSYTTLQAVLPTSYDRIIESQSVPGLFFVNLGGMRQEMTMISGGKWGVVNAKGELVLPCSKEMIYDFQDKDKEIALFNEGGTCSLEEYYSDYGETNVYYAYECQGGLFGLIDKKGKVVVPAQYNALTIVNNNLIIANKNGNVGLIDAKGKEITPFIYESITEDFIGENKVLKVKKDERYGYIDVKGNVVVPIKFSALQMLFKNNLDRVAVASEEMLWGVYNVKKDAMEVEPIYNEIKMFNEGYAAFNQEGVWGFLDEQLKPVVEAKFFWVSDFQNGYSSVKLKSEDGKSVYGMIDKRGEFIFKPIQSDYEVYFGVFKGGLNTMSFYGTDGSSYGLFNENGKILIPLGGANDIRVSAVGIATVLKNHKWAIVDKEGAMLTGYEYAFIDEFSEKQNVTRAAKGDSPAYEEMGYVYVENGLWGGINTQGREVIPFKFSYINPFKEGLAAAKSAEAPEKIAYTDLDGNWVLPFK